MFSKIGWTLFGFVLLAGSIWFFMGQWSEMKKYSDLEQWPTAIGRLSKLDVIDETWEDDYRTFHLFRLDIQYEYEVDGSILTGTSASRAPMSWSNQWDLEREIANYIDVENSSVTIRFDADQPEDSIAMIADRSLDSDGLGTGWWRMVMPGLFMGVMVVFSLGSLATIFS